ncbi:uncharacterized protein [Linepithema humile]|uniref:uncharacterized protein isoform X1 n=1 Tax=Linepithema humile TaxID=83485 RepID=UPI00351EABA5
MFCSILIILLQLSFLKKKVSRKYKIRAKNRIYEAFIRSKAKNIDVHQELEFDANQGLQCNETGTSFSICDPSNDGVNVIPQQYSMNINDEMFCNDNIEYGRNVNNNNAWINYDNHENINCNEFENEIVTQNVFQNEEEIKTYILTGLKKWGLYNVSKRKVDEILKLFKPILHFLPKSYKTLLKTPRKVSLQVVGTGQMWYKGIRHNIEQRINHQYLINNGQIIMDVNIDGIPLQKDSRKPNNLDLYLHNYIVEVAELTESGFECNGTVFPFCIRNYILDAQARSFIKQCVPHNSPFACEKCTVEGEWFHNRIIFENVNCELRTDDSFRRRENPGHHNGNSSLENINTGMVSQFRLDPMHLVYLGVFKRFLSYLIERRTHCRLPRDNVMRINNNLNEIAQYFPKEFNRKPRSLGNRDSRTKWKGTEFRRCLLYDGIKVFKDQFPQNIYHIFLLLHSAIYILSSSIFNHNLNHVADYLLKEFISHAARTLGRDFLVYNVHSIGHLAEECKNYGTLESFSAFPYENYLGVIKGVLRSNYKPLQQLANRDSETGGVLVENILSNSYKPVLKGRYKKRSEIFEGEQFTELIWKGMTFNSNEPNNCFTTIFGEVVFLSNIISTVRGVILVGKKFKQLENFYDFPLPSSSLGIYKVKEKERRRQYWNLSHVKAKCVTIPLLEGILCIPMVDFD